MFKKSQNGWLIAGFSEQDLGHERGLFFHRTDNPDGTFVYTPTKSPPVRIYNPAAGLPTPVRNPYGIAHSEPKFRVTGFGTEVCYR